MSGVVKAIGNVVGGVVKGVANAVGGVVKGVAKLVTGHPAEALSAVVGGVAKGAGEVVHGAISAVKDVVTDPILGTVASFIPGVGTIAGIAQSGVGLLDGLDRSVCAFTGAGDAGQRMAEQRNESDFGPFNAALVQGYYPEVGRFLAPGLPTALPF